MTVTTDDGACPDCWAYKAGPRYVIRAAAQRTLAEAVMDEITSFLFGLLMLGCVLFLFGA
jgi:hypothetical protein